ncbi:MAG: NERD domain-containing protein [Bdellovibrionales bacterium]|nr:NERD domain-containing protein [Bdellovibrionales bacterium]
MAQKYQGWKNSKRLKFLEWNFQEEVDRPLKKITVQALDLKDKFDHLEIHAKDEVLKRLEGPNEEKEKVDSALRQVTSWIVGARGERDVDVALEKLPDTFVVINDVVLHLVPPIKSNRGMRFQCQADHVVFGPPGVFNIDSKY